MSFGRFSPGRLVLVARIAPIVLAAGPVQAWPLPDPEAPPSALARPEAMPDDPDYPPRGPTGGGQCKGQTALYGFTPECVTGLGAEEAAAGVGMAVDRAWLLTRGSPHVIVAIVHDGFALGDADLGRSWWLNRGELPPPEWPSGPPPGPDRHDANGDGRFDVLDYTTATGTTAPRTATVVDRRLVARADGGDVNGNGRLDPDDLLRVFSDGVDDDANGRIDDAAGWDLVEEDATMPPGSGGGTQAARLVAAVTNNGVGGAGICPECRVLPLRAGTRGRARADDVASAVAIAAEVGAAVAVVGLDAPVPAAWVPPGRSDVLVLHEAGLHPDPSILDAVDAWVVGGYGPSGPPRTTPTFRAVDPCVRSGPRVAIRGPSRCDATAAARVAGVAALVASFRRAQEPERPTSPAALRSLLLATRRPAFSSGELATVRSLDARAALEAVRRGAPIPTGRFRFPDAGATVDPDRELTVRFEVTAPDAEAVSWHLHAELGSGGRSPKTRILAEGTTPAGTTAAEVAPVAVASWFVDPVAPPKTAEALAVQLVLTLEVPGLAAVPIERRFFVHRDLEGWPAFPLKLSGGVQAGLRRSDAGEIVVLTAAGRGIRIRTSGERVESISAPTSRRRAERGSTGEAPDGTVGPSPFRTAPTRLGPDRWAAPTADGDVVFWAFGAGVTPRARVLEPSVRAARPLVQADRLLFGLDDRGLVPVEPSGPVRRLPDPPAAAAVEQGTAWVASERALFRLPLDTGAVDPFPLREAARVAPAPVVFEADDARWVAAAWPGRPWSVRRIDDGASRSGLPVAGSGHLIAVDLDDDGHDDLAGVVEVPDVGLSLMAWSLREGGPLEGYPIALDARPPFAPVAGDVDGDRRADLVFVTEPTRVAAAGRGATMPPGFPKLVGEPVVAPPLVSDLDGDGRNDLVVATRGGRVFAYRTRGQREGGSAWRQARHDARATGNAATPDFEPGERSTGSGCRGLAGAGIGPGLLGALGGALAARGAVRRRRSRAVGRGP